ncbi:hypothetical protein BHE74_00013288 [Ensete ventricosum]|nr:hypothetical protein BHE74_00013288 [Ensete ventricosum]
MLLGHILGCSSVLAKQQLGLGLAELRRLGTNWADLCRRLDEGNERVAASLGEGEGSLQTFSLSPRCSKGEATSLGGDMVNFTELKGMPRAPSAPCLHRPTPPSTDHSQKKPKVGSRKMSKSVAAREQETLRSGGSGEASRGVG